jgi:NAD(P)-dependent dehydrogenase (short-subunit alcohol dehydrogenase family)
MEMARLDGKVALITGGVSGIGRASVQLFAEEGARVVIADIMDERGQALADELGPNAFYLHVDVSREDDVKAAVDLAVERFGGLHCMFNNAGIGGAGGPIDLIPAIGFDITIAVLFRSVFFGMKHAAPVMKRQGSGSIISTASIAGLRTGFGSHFYSACKAAVIHMTRTVAMELGPFGIRVNAICPGGIVTSIFGRALGMEQDAAEDLHEKLEGVFKGAQSIERAGLPEDIAKAAVWLASDDSSFVSGTAIPVDGAPPDGMFGSEEKVIGFLDALGVEIPDWVPLADR